MRLKTSLAAGTLAATLAMAVSANAAPVQFYLGSGFGSTTPDCTLIDSNPDTASCSKDGISLDVTGYAFNPNTGVLGSQRDLDWYSTGLSIGSDVDNQGTDEALGLSFSPDVQVLSVTFARVDTNDEFSFGVFNGSSTPDPYFASIDIPGVGIRTYTFFGTYVGGEFVVGTTPDNGGSDNDNWRLKYVKVDHIDPVPLPAAGWLLLAGVGGLAAMKRRKKA